MREPEVLYRFTVRLRDMPLGEFFEVHATGYQLADDFVRFFSGGDFTVAAFATDLVSAIVDERSIRLPQHDAEVAALSTQSRLRPCPHE